MQSTGSSSAPVSQADAASRDYTRLNPNQGPNEITIVDAEALHTILDGSRNPFTKPAWYDNLRPFTGLNTHRSKIVHEHRRRVWDQGFTTNGRLHTRVVYRPQSTNNRAP